MPACGEICKLLSQLVQPVSKLGKYGPPVIKEGGKNNATIRHFEVARETHFHCGVKFVPQYSPTMHFDNRLDPVSHATSKWRVVLDTGDGALTD